MIGDRLRLLYRCNICGTVLWLEAQDMEPLRTREQFEGDLIASVEKETEWESCEKCPEGSLRYAGEHWRPGSALN